jgi:diguanylate cyclase (GGDEF)-like protein
MMIDLDHFKKVNDTYGHEAATMFQAIATTLAVETRAGFCLSLWGEEFVIVMPNMDSHVAYERREITQYIEFALHPYRIYSLTITISMGIACYPANGLTRGNFARPIKRCMPPKKRGATTSFRTTRFPSQKRLDD